MRALQIPEALIVLTLAVAACGCRPQTSGDAASEISATVEPVKTTEATATGPVGTKKTESP